MAGEVVAGDALTRFLAPLAELFALRDQLTATGSLVQAAAEAQARLDTVGRDVDSARAQLDSLTTAGAVARDSAAGIIDAANVDANNIIVAAQAAADAKTAEQAATDAEAHAAAVSDLAALIDQGKVAQSALLAAQTAQANAEAATADAQAQLAAIVAKLGG